MQAFIGTYTRTEGHVDGQARGIYQVAVDSTTGQLYRTGVIPDITNPSFLVLSSDGRYLYAVSEVGGGADSTGYVHAYRIEGGEGQLLNRQPSHGIAPCHLAVHPSGNYLFTANYGGGIAMYPIREDGALDAASHVLYFEGSGPHPRQKASHPHSIAIDQAGRFAYVADLGTDKIMIFLIDLENGKLEAANTPFARLAPGAGPRHLAFHPNGQLLYAINELNNSITLFGYDRADGSLEALQTIGTLPRDYTGDNSCADIHIDPSGRYLYGSNRGHNSIAVFSVNSKNGFLEPVGYQPTGGAVPRNFNILPDGRRLYVANQNSNNIVYFNIDPDSGRLTPFGELSVPTPVCIQFAPGETSD